MTFKDKLNILFKKLRKEWIIARQNYWCCQSCAWASFTEEEEKLAIVFYHKQDWQNVKDWYVYLAHSSIELPEKELIEDICQWLWIDVIWDWTENQRIKLVNRIFKPGDVVKNKYWDEFIVYANYPNWKISFCIYWYDDSERDYQVDEKDYMLVF